MAEQYYFLATGIRVMMHSSCSLVRAVLRAFCYSLFLSLSVYLSFPITFLLSTSSVTFRIAINLMYSASKSSIQMSYLAGKNHKHPLLSFSTQLFPLVSQLEYKFSELLSFLKSINSVPSLGSHYRVNGRT